MFLNYCVLFYFLMSVAAWFERVVNNLSFRDKLALVLAFCVFLFLVYFNQNTGVWWDGASFIQVAQKFLGQSFCVPADNRLPGFPLLMLPVIAFFSVNFTLLHLEVFVFAFLSLIATYLLGRQLYDDRLGLAAEFLVGFSWLFFFYSERILAHVPGLFFSTLGLYLLLSGWDKSLKRVFLGGLMLGVYLTIRIDSLFLLLPVALFFLIEKRERLFVELQSYYSVAGFLVPVILFMIWQFAVFGSPIAMLSNNLLINGNSNVGLLAGLTHSFSWDYFTFSMLSHSFGLFVLVFLVLGLVYLFYKHDRSARFLLLIFVLFLFLLSLSPQKEDRFLIPLLPIVMVITAVFALKVAEFLKSLLSLGFDVNFVFVPIVFVLAVQSMFYGFPIFQSKVTTYTVPVQMSSVIGSNLNNATIVAPFADSAPDPQLCLFASDENYVNYPSTLAGLEAMPLNTYVYYSFPYDGNVNYLSIQQFFVQNNLGQTVLDNAACRDFLNSTGLQVVSVLVENQTSAVSILYRKVEPGSVTSFGVC